MGAGDRIGKIEKGYLGDLTVVDGDYFDPETDVRSVWIRGREIRLKVPSAPALTGDWSVMLDSDSLRLRVSGEAGDFSGEIQVDSSNWISVKQLVLDDDRLSFTVELDFIDRPGTHRIAGHISESKISGQVSDPAGTMLTFSGIKISDPEPKEPKSGYVCSFRKRSYHRRCR